MALTTIKNTWQTNEIVDAEAMNRIESNIEAGAYHSFTQGHNTTAGALGSATFADVNNATVSHTTQTGRVQIHCSLCVQGSANAQYELTIRIDGANVNGSTFIAKGVTDGGTISGVNHHHMFDLHWATSGLSVGVHTVSIAYRLTQGAAATKVNTTITVIDI